MRKSFIFSVVCTLSFLCGSSFAQNVGIGTTTPNGSAALDVSSITKGFLPPRMTLSERNSINNPVAGLMIWCSNCGGSGQVQVYDGLGWTPLLATLAIGDSYGGGKVAYIFQPGDPGFVQGERHGLIAAASDQGTSTWGCHGIEIPGAEGQILGTGNQNTLDIVNGCATAGIAARICNDLQLGGYNDWFLPSIVELNKLYLNRVAIGGFTILSYWSSSEEDPLLAFYTNFSNGTQFWTAKSGTNYIRAIRTF